MKPEGRIRRDMGANSGRERPDKRDVPQNGAIPCYEFAAEEGNQCEPSNTLQ
jgi:hypothetical protein